MSEPSNIVSIANGELDTRRAKIIPLATEEQYLELCAKANEDKHPVVTPSHLVTIGGEIVGYGSIANCPIFSVWTHSKKVSAMDSVRLLHQAESIAKAMGHTQYIMPCSTTSPYFKHMKRFGFAPMGNFSLYWKSLV